MRHGTRTLSQAVKAVGLAMLACVAVMVVTGSIFGLVIKSDEGAVAAFPFAYVGSLAFFLAAVLLCVPVLTFLTTIGRLPKPRSSAAVGALIAMPATHVILAGVFSGDDEWLKNLAGLPFQPITLFNWFLPFAVPGPNRWRIIIGTGNFVFDKPNRLLPLEDVFA